MAWLRVGQASRVFLGHLPSFSDLGINNNKRKRFQVLNFTLAAILDFMTSLRCPGYCFKQKKLSFPTIETTQ